ncbi:MAG: extracellular solute-binding protein [Lachnospiraceae bacterium]|nr:extracellular solute-binding protein [Lachnospiraceae bacterium]
MKKYHYIFILSFLLLSLTACNSKSASESTQIQENALGNIEAYTEVPLEISHLHIFDEYMYQNYLFYLAVDGESEDGIFDLSEKLPPVFIRIDLDNPDSTEIIPIEIPEDHQLQQIAVGDDGNVHILASKMDGYDIAGIVWYEFDLSGNMRKKVDISESLKDFHYYFPLDFIIDSNGNAYIAFALTNGIFAVNPLGELAFHIPIRNNFKFFFKDMEGLVYALHSPALVLAANFPEKNLLEYADLSGQGRYFIGLSKINDHLLTLANGDGVYDYDIVNEVLHERFQWSAINIHSHDGLRAYPLSGSRLLLAKRPENVGDIGYPKAVRYSIIRPKNAEDIAKEEAQRREWEALKATGEYGSITLGIVGSISLAINEAVREFNARNPYSLIEIKQYGESYSSDHSGGLSQLSNDIIVGKGPDILLLPQDLSFGAYVIQGAFKDLYPYLLADEDFDMANYRENVFRAYEMEGGLYGIPLSFYVEALYGRASELEGKNSWNIDEFIDFADRFPDSLIFQHPTKTAVLDICLKANGKNMVDWSSIDPKFDRELLVKILEFANRFIDADRYSDERMVSERISGGDIHLMAGYASPNTQYEMEIFGNRISHIGYPSENTSGYLISSNEVVAISSKCQYTGTAWQFISYLLSDEFQSQLFYPVKLSSLSNYLDYAKKGYGGGTISIIDDGIDVSYEVRGATDDEINLFLSLLEAASEIRIFDQQIDGIIKEEAGAFFAGNKAVEEVALVIENRVGIYIKELK